MQPLLGHMHKEFFDIMDDVKHGIQYVFQTQNPLTFAVSGTGHAGMECALLNLLERGETILGIFWGHYYGLNGILVVQNGVWGQRAASLAERLGLVVRTLKIAEGDVINLEDFAEVFPIDYLLFWILSILGRRQLSATSGISLPWRKFGEKKLKREKFKQI
jgi:aspartate aminotransferase-like enzyme